MDEVLTVIDFTCPNCTYYDQVEFPHRLELFELVCGGCLTGWLLAKANRWRPTPSCLLAADDLEPEA